MLSVQFPLNRALITMRQMFKTYIVLIMRQCRALMFYVRGRWGTSESPSGDREVGLYIATNIDD